MPDALKEQCALTPKQMTEWKAEFEEKAEAVFLRDN